jgi:hypothetical protein
MECRRSPCDAAHVRIGALAGIGQKPSDRRTTPLCHKHHMEQHSVGERTFWARLGRDPEQVIVDLNRTYPDIEAMTAVVLRG